jgi:hypothetical protein
LTGAAARAAAWALLLLAGPASAQSESRWALMIRGPALSERGELRLGNAEGRLLLESADSAWLPLSGVRTAEGQIVFSLPATGRRFEGTADATEMQGNLYEPDGRVIRWTAERIPVGITRWPVRPRVRVKQLRLGTSDSVVTLPSAWRAALPAAALITAERDSLARAAGLRAPTLNDLIDAQRIALGLDSAGRAAARAQLARIAVGPAADASFRRLFGTPGQLRFDLHQVAFASVAVKRVPEVDRSPAILVRGLKVFTNGVMATSDTLSLYAMAWRAWSRSHTDSIESRMLLDSLTARDPVAARAVRAIFAGYDESLGWWVEALAWLLNNPWIETPRGFQSPVALVGEFWGRALTLPPLEPTYFGSVQAVPVIGASRLGSRLVRPLNASAVEWLAQAGTAAALAAWRSVDSYDTLTLVRAGQPVQLTAPAAVARSRLGGFLAGRDAIRIEPGIAPIFAIATVLHEWQHLLFEGARLEGSAPGVQESANELTLLDGNPWLVEGSAEWATEAVLAPGRRSTPLLPLMEAVKRGSIALTGGDDPHVLGYLLVRAVAARSRSATELRERLVQSLHDPLAVARAYRLDGAVRSSEPLRLNRPASAGIIPEMSFTWDDGVADQLTRRLLIPAPSQER